MEHGSLPPYLQHSSSKNILLGLLFLIALGSIGAGAFSLLQSSASFAPPIPSTQSTLPSFHPTTTLTVDVSGAVQNPGIQKHTVVIGENLRIADLIASAGGLRKDADSTYIAKELNLASTVADGYKLYIPKIGEQKTESTVLGKTTTSINRASKDELMKLSGIGESRATAIIENRPYSSFDELLSKAKIPKSTFEKIKAQISL